MTSVEIEYCVPRGLLDLAIEAQTRLLNEFGRELDSVTLIPGHGGGFIPTADGETIWDKRVHGADLSLDLIVDAINDRLPAEA